MNSSIKVLFCTILAVCYLSLVGCEDDIDPLDIPTEYDATNFSANTANEVALTQQLSALATEARKGRTNGVVVSEQALEALWGSESAGLRSITSTYYESKLDGDNGFIATLADASGGTYTPGPPTGNGGTFGGYLFDANGLEMEQMIDKGSYGAALYNYAAALLNGTLTESTPDQVIALFGTTPAFPNSNDATKHEVPDRFLAGYAARRDKNDGTGFYTQFRDNVIKLQAAIKAGDDYRADQQSAISAIKENWEKANAATMINYLHSVISTLSSTNPTDQQKGGALHSYSEAVGFIHGWRGVGEENKIITDAQIDEVLVLLNAPSTGTPTSYKFVTDAVNELPKLQQVITKLQDIYDFTDLQIEEFKKNWVAEQGR